MKNCVVIGSSRGLGAALVNELFRSGERVITGIDLTRFQDNPDYKGWVVSGKYRHFEMDIGKKESVAVLRKIVEELPPEPLLLFFNAACSERDVDETGAISFQIFEKVNRVGVDGFCHVLQAFEGHFLRYGGILVGISSINALMPPVLEPKVGYSATKAYLDMALRCLALTWPEKIKVATVHLGHIGGKQEEGFLKNLLKPSYQATAKTILRKVLRQKVHCEITYPFVYNLTYQYLFKLFSDRLYFRLMKLLLSLTRFGQDKRG